MNANLDRLTDREKDVLRLLAQGHDGKSIAASLGLSLHAVNERLRSVRRKLGVPSSREAARLFARHEAEPRPQAPHEFSELGGKAEIGGKGIGSPDPARPSLLFAGALMTLILAAALIAYVVHDDARPARPTPPSASALPTLPAQALGDLSASLDDPQIRALAAKAEAGRLVDFRLGVDAQGRVASCTATGSSGSSELDARLCALIRARARFRPARDARGRAVADQIRTRIGFPAAGASSH